MVLTRRERYIAIVTSIVIALLVLDRFALSPVLNRLGALRDQKQALQEKLAHGEALLRQKAAADAWWQEKTSGGLKQTADETEPALDNAVLDWAGKARLNVISHRAQRSSQLTHAPEVGVLIVASGHMKAVTDFLINAKKSPLPVKIVNLELRSSPEGTDELSLNLRLSGLYLPADWPPRASGAASATGGTHK